MDDDKTPVNKRLNEQLPLHSPDPGAWQRLSAKLDALDAETAYYEKLEQLPLHSPNQGTWTIIQRKLGRIAYYKAASRTAMAVAAGLLLFFTVSQISNFYHETPSVPMAASQKPARQLPVATDHNQPAVAQITGTSNPDIQSPVKSDGSPLATNKAVLPAGIRQSSPEQPKELPAPTDSDIAFKTETPVPVENSPETLAETILIPDGSLSLPLAAETPAIVTETVAPASGKQLLQPSAPPPVKYYTPKDPKTGASNHVALGMDYLPENIYNGTNNSLFHNLDLTASYNKEKVRFNTSVGMAYNEEQLNFDMNYDVNSPVTAIGPGGQMDTLGYNVSTVESQYQGTEKHQYFTYNLGIGRRLFSTGKFSTWLNAGTGIGFRLNDPDLITSTEKSIKVQYNATITSVATPHPVYNDVYVNFVTAIDFNYRILNKLSFTFTPTSRWYFKPVLTKNNQATDEMTVGFRTGLKFDF